MNIEELRDFCLDFPQTTEGFPFDEHTLVLKVANKMFALISLDSQPLSINLKCDPQVAVELREKYPAVKPGYHMNKQHWNTVTLDGSISNKEIKDWITTSFDLVVSSLPKKKQAEIKAT